MVNPDLNPDGEDMANKERNSVILVAFRNNTVQGVLSQIAYTHLRHMHAHIHRESMWILSPLSALRLYRLWTQ